MRAALGVVMLVASCSDVHGVAVLVHPNNPDVRYVRLFMGAGSSATADLTPDSGVTAGSAAYWVRDPGNACDTCDVIAATGSVVKFGFVTDTTVPVVIAVGYDAQKNPIAAGVAHDLAPSDHSNDFFGYELDLAPFQPFSSQTSSPLQLDLWSPPDVAKDPFLAECAGIIDANADHPYFVVRDGDQDCDGLIDGMPGECTPDYYLGTAPADPADATCLVGETTKCRLGGMGCADTGATAPACSPSETCLPTNLCATCASSYACAAQITGPIATQTAHYACTVHLKGDGSACSDTLPLDRPPTGGYDCTGIQIADATTHLGNDITQAGVTITAEEQVDATTSCAGTLTFSGMPSSPSGTMSAMVDFALKNNAGIAMPVTIQFQNGACGTPTPCILDAHVFDDVTQTACATAWTGPSSLVALPDASATDSSDPTLTPDLKQMFYESGGTIVQVKFNNGWANPAVLAVTGNVSDHAPELSGTGLALVITSTNGAALTSLYISNRPNLNAAFGMAIPLASLDSQVVFTAATFAPDDTTGHHLIAAGTSNGVAPSVLYDLLLDPTSHAIMQQTPITLNVANADHPHLSADGLHLYFDAIATGPSQIYVASRRTIGESFRLAVRLPELDDVQDLTSSTSGAWVAAGGKTMYFTRTVGGVKHIYQTSRVSF